jgi:hypothetical protein
VSGLSAATDAVAQDWVTAPPAVRAKEDDDDPVPVDAIPLIPSAPASVPVQLVSGTPYWIDGRGQRHRMPERHRWIYFAGELGPVYRQLSGLSMVGASLFAGVDLELRTLAVRIGVTFEGGRLFPALNLYRAGLGGALEGVFGVFRVGGGLGFGVVDIPSVTADPAASAPEFELGLRTSVDVAKLSSSGRAFYVGAKLDASVLLGNGANPILLGPSLVFGLRL